MSQCSEPDGRETVRLTASERERQGVRDSTTAHAAMLHLTGQCPWCGQTE